MPPGTPITGRKLLIKNPPAGPASNKLVFPSKDASLQTPQNVGQDPRCVPDGSGSVAAGGSLRLVGLGGDVTIDLPCANWSVNGAGNRYRY